MGKRVYETNFAKFEISTVSDTSRINEASAFKSQSQSGRRRLVPDPRAQDLQVFIDETRMRDSRWQETCVRRSRSHSNCIRALRCPACAVLVCVGLASPPARFSNGNMCILRLRPSCNLFVACRLLGFSGFVPRLPPCTGPPGRCAEGFLNKNQENPKKAAGHE